MSKPRGTRTKTKEGHYKLFWIVNGKVMEEIHKDRPLPFYTACWRANILETTTHRTGRIDVVPSDTKAFEYKQFNLF